MMRDMIGVVVTARFVMNCDKISGYNTRPENIPRGQLQSSCPSHT